MAELNPWDQHYHLVATHGQGGVRFLAKQRGKEMKQEQMGALNMLKLKQSFLTSKIRDNSQSSLTELTTINLKISQWYSDESEKITLMSRSEDIKLNEKVRIYHHGQHRQFRKRSSILKLLTAEGAGRRPRSLCLCPRSQCGQPPP